MLWPAGQSGKFTCPTLYLLSHQTQTQGARRFTVLSPPSHTQASGSEGGRGPYGGDAPRKGFKQGQTSSRRQADRARASVLKEPVHVSRLIERSDSAQRESRQAYGAVASEMRVSTKETALTFPRPQPVAQLALGLRECLQAAPRSPGCPCTCAHLGAPVGTERRHDPVPRGLGQSRRRLLSAPCP